MKRLVLIALATILAAAGARAATHEDERLGFKVRTPNGWEQIPVAISEKWIVMKYVSDREHTQREENNRIVTFKPEMRVIVFPFEVTEDRGTKRTTRETEHGTTTWFEFKNPYEDYEDYLDRNYRGGGWFVSREEEKESGDLEWTLKVIKVEKLARGGRKRIVTGTFHAEDADFVVQFELLEDSYEKLYPELKGCLESFRFIERKGKLVEDEPERVDEEELTPKELHERRVKIQEAAWKRAAEQLPRGWRAKKYKDMFLVLSHCDSRFLNYCLNQGVAVWKWLDKNLDFLGDGEVRPLIVRICETSEEASRYHDTSGDAWFGSSSTKEVVLYRGNTFSWLHNRVMANWIHDKDPDVFWELPSWVRWGLSDLIGNAHLKGSRLRFLPDVSAMRTLRIAAQKGELKSLREFLTSPSGDFLPLYLEACRFRALEREKEREAAGGGEVHKAPETEEEEEEAFRRRHQRMRDDGAWAARERENLTWIFDEAFGEMDESDWKSIEKSYRAFILRN